MIINSIVFEELTNKTETAMRKYALQLYNSMQRDIGICRTKAFDEEKEIECCSQICNHYWHQLQKSLADHQFETIEEEIDFFKHLKPLFTAEIEYYNLMLHAQLFRPLYGKTAIRKFWLRESLRLEKFSQANYEFYTYHKNGKTNFDRFFYLRKFNDSPTNSHPDLAEIEKKTSTRNDRLLAEYAALEKYAQYVQKQLDNINITPNGNQ